MTASRIMLYNSLRVMSNSRCASYFLPGLISDNVICGETNGTVSICGSDIGDIFLTMDGEPSNKCKIFFKN